MKRNLCVNCRKAIHGKVNRDSSVTWQHILPNENCENPEPYPGPPPCTCNCPHFHCYVVTCKCKLHSYYVLG